MESEDRLAGLSLIINVLVDYYITHQLDSDFEALFFVAHCESCVEIMRLALDLLLERASSACSFLSCKLRFGQVLEKRPSDRNQSETDHIHY